MRIRLSAFCICALSFMALTASAQTLFTYGKYAVSKNEFLQAYNKNPDSAGSRQQKIDDYLKLYINFRLKLQAAYDEKANTNQDLKNEADNFKSQLIDNFINQQANINELLHEAYIRSKKDILLQQVFVPVKNNDDTTEAYNQIAKAYAELKGGKNFDDVAQEYSTDDAVKSTKGVIGYITVFTLPYPIENIVYNLPANGFSTIYKSNAGYHIFKNAGERQALGTRKIQQLLFSTPEFFSAEQIEAAHKQADSVYNLLQNGTTFETLLPLFGKSYEQTNTTENITVKVGDYSTDFEDQVFNLKKIGDVSQPFKTTYGYNIIKLVEAITPATDENDVTYTAFLQQQIQNDGRLDLAKQNLTKKWMLQTHFKNADYNKTDLWNYTDTALMRGDKLPESVKSIKPSTVLFGFEKKNYTVTEWIAFLRSQTEQVSSNDYDKEMQNFINASCVSYYREHIEDYDPAIKEQLKEFNDANMLFYVMDKHVWSKASQDSAGLKKYYTEHSGNYQWNKSVTALVVSGQDKATITVVSEKIKHDPEKWRTIIAGYGNSIYADSNRFEQDQLPVKQQVSMEKDFQTTPEANDAGDAFTFIHLINVYPQSQPRSFEDAKGLVINDYQEQLENEWLESLKKVYPVKVNEAVLKTLY